MGKNKKKVAANRAKKQARRNAKKKVQTKSSNMSQSAKLAATGTSRAAIRKAPFVRALMSPDLFENGMGEIMIFRDLNDGRWVGGIFLVDSYCLGVKDCFLNISPPEESEEQFIRTGNLKETSEAEAIKTIQGAMAYADSLGFKPRGEFKDASLILRELEEGECNKTFEFGRDGKPFFISGPNLNTSECRAIMDHLTTRCGKDGFHFMMEDNQFM